MLPKVYLTINLKEVKHDICKSIIKYYHRGLTQTTKWLSELGNSLQDVGVEWSETSDVLKESNSLEDDCCYYMVKTYFDLKEYSRCAFFSKGSINPKIRFLYFYSKYLSGEKKRIEDLTDFQTHVATPKIGWLHELSKELLREYECNKLDSFGLYLYGIVLRRLSLTQQATDILNESLHIDPMNWGAWLELSLLLPSRDKVKLLSLPEHWMKYFFLGHTYMELQAIDEALDMYTALQLQGFDKCTYITAQIALGFNFKRNIDLAINQFEKLQEIDPYRLDNLDIFSNLLYVKEDQRELANLSHHANDVDRFRVETCCITANYYSCRGEHEKAVLYLQRALKLNPNYVTAWTLIGHEYVELRNTSAAILSYRRALEVNRRDYRAWYGLGQAYEILKLMSFSAFYYKKAQKLRANDSRMLVALGEVYEKMGKFEIAIKCYYRGRNVGDVEGSSLLKLAKLLEKRNQFSLARKLYKEYLKDNENLATANKAELCQVYIYLAIDSFNRDILDEAYKYAVKALEDQNTVAEARSLLKAIAERRYHDDDVSSLISERSKSVSPRSNNNNE